jgi:hypothetical protein
MSTPLHHLLSKQLILTWQEHLASDPTGFYENLLQHINKIEPQGMRDSILKNANEIYQWMIGDDERLHAAAIESLINARILLAIVEACNSNSLTNSRFFVPTEMMKGAHILIEDNGALLDHILAAKALHPRYSSHYKQDKIAKHMKDNPLLDASAAEALFNHGKQDYSLRAEVIFNEAVMGKVTKGNGKIYTWFQFEGHSHQARSVYKSRILQALDCVLQFFSYSLEKLLHHIDFVNYVWNGKTKNIGQYGKSEYTEKNPIALIPGEVTKLGPIVNVPANLLVEHDEERSDETISLGC